MTKSWDDVREYVCRLYLNEGKSLSEIERILREERDFQASYEAMPDMHARAQLSEGQHPSVSYEVEGMESKTTRQSTQSYPGTSFVGAGMQQLAIGRSCHSSFDLVRGNLSLVQMLIIYIVKPLCAIRKIARDR